MPDSQMSLLIHPDDINPLQFADHVDVCSLCDEQHMPRTVYRCAQCNRPFCIKQVTNIGPDQPLVHFTKGETVENSFCGYAFATDEQT